MSTASLTSAFTFKECAPTKRILITMMMLGTFSLHSLPWATITHNTNVCHHRLQHQNALPEVRCTYNCPCSLIAGHNWWMVCGMDTHEPYTNMRLQSVSFTLAGALTVNQIIWSIKTHSSSDLSICFWVDGGLHLGCPGSVFVWFMIQMWSCLPQSSLLWWRPLPSVMLVVHCLWILALSCLSLNCRLESIFFSSSKSGA